MQWLRLYHDIIDDPKMDELTHAQRWLWIVILVLASASPERGRLLLVQERSEFVPGNDSGTFPERSWEQVGNVSGNVPISIRTIAKKADMPVEDVERSLELFAKLGMLHRDEQGVWCVTNWAKRQPQSDDVTSRTRKHKARKATEGTFRERSAEQVGNVPGNVPGTASDTDTDSDLREKEQGDTYVSPCAFGASKESNGDTNVSPCDSGSERERTLSPAQEVIADTVGVLLEALGLSQKEAGEAYPRVGALRKRLLKTRGADETLVDAALRYAAQKTANHLEEGGLDTDLKTGEPLDARGRLKAALNYLDKVATGWLAEQISGAAKQPPPPKRGGGLDMSRYQTPDDVRRAKRSG